MKLSPNMQYAIVFWFYTWPIVLWAIVLVSMSFINPFWRQRVLTWVDFHVDKICRYRNDIPMVVKYYNKAHLFDMLRED